MPADPIGTTRTPWAAVAGHEERLEIGATREEAIAAAVAEIEDAIGRGDLARPESGTVRVTVYRDVLWCDGEEVGDTGACACGVCHDDYPWMALAWGERTTTVGVLDAR